MLSHWVEFMNAPKLNPLKRDEPIVPKLEMSISSRSQQQVTAVHTWFSVVSQKTYVRVFFDVFSSTESKNERNRLVFSGAFCGYDTSYSKSI